jgi:hypothetical protein
LVCLEKTTDKEIHSSIRARASPRAKTGANNLLVAARALCSIQRVLLNKTKAPSSNKFVRRIKQTL